MMRSLTAQSLVRWILQVLAKSDLTRMAAALSYRTVFGIIPVLAIGVAILGGFASDEQVEESVREVLKFTGLSDIVVNPQAIENHDQTLSNKNAQPKAADDAPAPSDTQTPPPEPDTSEEPTAATSRAVPAASETRLDQWLQNLVLEVRKISFVAIGFTGLITLAYAAISFMVEIERSANHIYRAPTGRSWVRRITQYWTTLTLGSLFLIGTFYVSNQVTVVLTRLGDSVNIGAHVVGGAVSILISFLLLLFMYMTIPNTRVSLRSAAIGAAFAAVLWEAGKVGFAYFVTVSKTSLLYGAIALVPLFLLWVYITWLIVLFGLQLSYVLQNYATLAQAEENSRSPLIVDSMALVRVALAVGQAFVQGRAVSVADIARAVSLDDRTTLIMLERLIEAGVVHRVPFDEGIDGFSLAKPASQIKLSELLRLARSMTLSRSANQLHESDLLSTIEHAEQAAAGSTTLADLLGIDNKCSQDASATANTTQNTSQNTNTSAPHPKPA